MIRALHEFASDLGPGWECRDTAVIFHDLDVDALTELVVALVADPGGRAVRVMAHRADRARHACSLLDGA